MRKFLTAAEREREAFDLAGRIHAQARCHAMRPNPEKNFTVDVPFTVAVALQWPGPLRRKFFAELQPHGIAETQISITTNPGAAVEARVTVNLPNLTTGWEAV